MWERVGCGRGAYRADRISEVMLFRKTEKLLS